MGRSTPPSYELPPEAADLPEPLLERSTLGTTLDLASVFPDGSRFDAVELEIGFGKGRFLLGEAAARPRTAFLGVEHAAPYARLVRYKVLADGLRNVRVINADVNDLLAREVFPADAFAQIHVLFPDPWPKRRHHKRRLIQPLFLERVVRILAPDGRLNIATDHPAYAPVIRDTLAAFPGLSPCPEFALDGDIAARSHFGCRYGTHDGHAIVALSWARTP